MRESAAPSAGSTRQRLVRAAADLVWERGYHATGINDILRRADASSGSLYHFFSGKEALLHGILDDYEERLGEEILGPAFAATEDPVERVFAVLAVYRDLLAGFGCGRGCPIGNLALEVSDADPEARARIARIFDSWAGAIEESLSAAGDRLPADADRAGLARLVLTVMEGAVLQVKAYRSLEPFDQSVDQLRRYFDLLQRQPEGRPGP